MSNTNLSQRIRSYFNGDLTANIYEIIALIFEQQDGIAWQGGSILPSSTYTLSDADNGKILIAVSAPVTVVVPNTLTKGFSVTLVQGGTLTPITVSTSAPMSLIGNPAVTVTGGEGSYFVFKMISTSPPVGLLTAADASGGGGGISELTGDVTAGPGSGSQASTVVALQGNAISTNNPFAGDVLTWNGVSSEWEPVAPYVPPSAISLSFQGEVTGTSPVVIGAVYLASGTTLLDTASALLGTVSGGTATLRLIKQSDGSVLTSWSVTGAIAPVSLGTPVNVVASDWYLFDLAGSGAGTVSRAYGVKLEV